LALGGLNNKGDILMKQYLTLGFMAIMGLLLTACATQKLEVPPEVAQEPVAKEYRIGIGDGLQIKVWGNEQLSTDVPVRPDGKISIQLVGDVVAADLTAQQLSAELAKLLEKYVRNPQVTVTVTNPTSSDFIQRIRVTGAVNKPMSIPYRKGMTVLDVVLEAGNLTQFANGNDAKLYRETPEGAKAYTVLLDDLVNKGQMQTNYKLYPGDVITVPDRVF
jgi:polysaccharide export outer membrane protein